MAVTYCNITTDLTRAFSEVMSPKYKGLKTLSGYVAHSGNVYKVYGTGYVEALYEDNVKGTLTASIATVDAVNEWYYDSTNDVLYFYATGGVPDDHDYLYGDAWDSVVSACVEIASREADALLDKKFTVPIPRSPHGTALQPFDREFAHAVALIACGHIVGRIDAPNFDTTGTALNAAARLLSEGRSVIAQYESGEKSFSWAITADEVGGHNIIPGSSNTSVGVIQTRGTYDPDWSTSGAIYTSASDPSIMFQDPFWKVKITTAGTVGTATYQTSVDNGTTYNGTDITTSTDWKQITNNIWIRFLAVAGGATDFVLNDTWQMEIYSPTREVTNPSIKSIPVRIG